MLCLLKASCHNKKRNWGPYFTMPRSEEEGRAWAAINSIDDNFFKSFLKFSPILTVAAIVVAVTTCVTFAVRESPMSFWDWFVLIAICASCASLIYSSIKVRRRGIGFFFSDEAEKPLEILSGSERNAYRALSWITIALTATMSLILSLALFLHFTGRLSLGVPVWLIVSAGCLLSVCLVFLLVHRTRRLVRKMTSSLANENVSAPAADS